MTDPRIIHIAAQQRPSTKVAAKAALKTAGLKQTLADELLAQVASLDAKRGTAKLDRIDRRLGYCPVAPESRSTARRWGSGGRVTGRRDGAGIHIRKPEHGSKGRAPVRLPSGTAAQRLTAVRQATVLATLDRLIDKHAHGEWSCTLTTDPAKVGITSSQYYTGESAGKWRTQATDTMVTVPADWRVRVQRRGLAIVDGLMTLDASPLEAQGCELFAATWARRTGAKNIAVDHGYIARAGAVTYHGATIDQALTGLSRKSRALALTAYLNAADLSELVAKAPGRMMYLKDARAVGACDYGIKSWVASTGLDIGAGGWDSAAACIESVYAAYQREPRPEARAAILHALRRQRAVIEAA